MLFRLIGFALVALGAGILWFVKPRPDGTYRYPRKYEQWVGNFAALLVTAVIGLGVPFLLFGAPLSGDGP